MKVVAISLGLAALLCGPALINPCMHEASAAQGTVAAQKAATKAYKVKQGIIVVNTYEGGTLDAALNGGDKYYDKDAYKFLSDHGIELNIDKHGVILQEKLAEGVTPASVPGTQATAAMPANAPAGTAGAAVTPAGSTAAGASAAEAAAALAGNSNNASMDGSKPSGISVSK